MLLLPVAITASNPSILPSAKLTLSLIKGSIATNSSTMAGISLLSKEESFKRALLPLNNTHKRSWKLTAGILPAQITATVLGLSVKSYLSQNSSSTSLFNHLAKAFKAKQTLSLSNQVFSITLSSIASINFSLGLFKMGESSERAFMIFDFIINSFY